MAGYWPLGYWPGDTTSGGPPPPEDMSTSDAIKARLQAIADASGDPDLQTGIGTPGAPIIVRGDRKTTGAAYHVPGFLDSLIRAIGGEFDAAPVSLNVHAEDAVTNVAVFTDELIPGMQLTIPANGAGKWNFSFSTSVYALELGKRVLATVTLRINGDIKTKRYPTGTDDVEAVNVSINYTTPDLVEGDLVEIHWQRTSSVTSSTIGADHRDLAGLLVRGV